MMNWPLKFLAFFIVLGLLSFIVTCLFGMVYVVYYEFYNYLAYPLTMPI